MSKDRVCLVHVMTPESDTARGPEEAHRGFLVGRGVA